MHCNNCAWVVGNLRQPLKGFTVNVLLLGRILGMGLKRKRDGLSLLNRSVKRISSRCSCGPLLFPYHKHLSKFIWLHVWLKQMSRLCCLPWVSILACTQKCECACTLPIQGELERPVIYLNNYNQSCTAQIMNVWSSELIINSEKKHPRSYFIA